MIELELLGTSADGESLVLTDAQGERYSVLISDELRGATRRHRPRVELTREHPTLSPREIQAFLRAGATPEEIASRHGMDVSAVERFEAPVLAEKDYALTRARAVRIGEGGPTMGDLVVDRLAARGVDPASLEWAATREASEPWRIIVTFVQGAAEHAAHWKLSHSGVLEAVDQEAQWLTEQVSSSPASSIFTPLPRATPLPDADQEELLAREALVDQLNAARGTRQKIDFSLGDEEDEEAEYLAAIAGDDDLVEDDPGSHTASISAHIYSMASARTKVEPSDSGETASPLTPPEAGAVRHHPVGQDGPRTKEAGREAPSGGVGALSVLLSDQSSRESQEESSEQAGSQSPTRAEADHTSEGAGPGIGVARSRALPPSRNKARTPLPTWREIVVGSKQ